MGNQVSKCIRYALAACSISALAAPSVFAQSAPASADQTAASTAQLGKIEVTGTRIKRTSVETAQPITVITAQQIQASGLATVGDVLQNMTQSGNSLTLQGETHSGGNVGASSINLRYLGANRVLVLVNGRRWTSGLDGTVDLSAIPSSIIDHIEVLQDGASAIYGSDAITGVVNIITVHNFNGAEAHAYTGIYHNDYDGVAGWDGKKQQYDFTIGDSGAHSGIVINLSYLNEDSVQRSNRAQSREPVWTQGRIRNPPITNNAPGFFTIESPSLAGADLGSATCSNAGVCSLGVKNMPAFNPTLDNFVNERSSVYNEDIWDSFTPPFEESNIFLKGHYDIADNLTFTTMAAYSDRNGTGTLSPQPLLLGSGGFYKANGMGVGIGKNNPYNPFGVDLVGNESQYCPTGGEVGGVPMSCTPNYLLSFYERFVPETGPRLYTTDVGTATFRGGVNGFFDALGNEWDWDAGYSFGKVTSAMRISGLSNDASIATQWDAPGFQQCNGPAQSTPGSSGTWQEINGMYYQILSPGCVPMNPFGGYNASTGQGSITPEMAAYNTVTVNNLSQQTMRDYDANITGSLINLPAGPLGIAIGGEYLEQDGLSQPDPLAVSGNLDNNKTAPTAGRTWAHAEYVEFDIPLLSDVPMAKALSVDLANRWSQFSWQGEEPSSSDSTGGKHGANATTGRAQVRWQTSSDLLLRASWAQGFRAPDIDDLYAPGGEGFPVIQDPCAPVSANGGWNPSTPLPAGCHGIVHSQPFVAIGTVGGGNPNLTPETAISRSFGFVYSPSWLTGFNVSADYYKIELNNEIGSVGAPFILQECYINDDPQYCSHIVTSGNIISQIDNTDLNVGSISTNGVDLDANYDFSAGSLGSFNIATTWTFLRSFVSVQPTAASPTGFASIEESGFVVNSEGFPKTKGSITANWNLGNWSANWNIQYIGKMYERCSGLTIQLSECSDPNAIYSPLDSVGKNQLGTTIYHDVQVGYHFSGSDIDLAVGIRNLFNKQYPAALSASELSYIAGVGYRTPGRFIYTRLGVKF